MSNELVVRESLSKQEFIDYLSLTIRINDSHDIFSMRTHNSLYLVCYKCDKCTMIEFDENHELFFKNNHIEETLCISYILCRSCEKYSHKRSIDKNLYEHKFYKYVWDTHGEPPKIIGEISQYCNARVLYDSLDNKVKLTCFDIIYDASYRKTEFKGGFF